MSERPETQRLGEALDALQPHVPEPTLRQWREDLAAVRDLVGQSDRTELYGGYSAKCERWTLGTCDVMHYDDRPPCRICAFFVALGYESFEVTSGGLRSWRAVSA